MNITISFPTYVERLTNGAWITGVTRSSPYNGDRFPVSMYGFKTYEEFEKHAIKMLREELRKYKEELEKKK